jgi:cell shape-determining protein MreC
MSEEPSTEEQLMSALISKMETMDNDIKAVQRENEQLKKMLNNPTAILRTTKKFMK